MPDDTLNLLLIEDNPGDARYIQELLQELPELGDRTLGRMRAESDDRTDDGGNSLTLIHESRLSPGLERLEEGDIDIVLLDLNLPDSQKLETLTALRRVSDTVPVIVLTGVRDREMGMEAFHKGADEYLVKDQINGDLLIRSIYHAIVHKHDECELKRQRDRLQAKTERLDEFAGIVAHDLRNPLSVATGALSLAQSTGDDEILGEVVDALERMDRLIDDLLRLARQGEHVEEPQSIDLASVAHDAWAYVATDGASLDTDEVADSGHVLADPDRLAQLLENLFGNSVEHGSTSSRTQSEDDTEHVGTDVTVRVGLLPSGFFVEDDGPGIPPDERDHVFEAGYTTDPSGTGFGLSIVRDIASAHGWEVSLVEGASGGTRFEFTGVDRP